MVNGLDGREFQIRSLSEWLGGRLQKREPICGAGKLLSGFPLAFPERFQDAKKCPVILLTSHCLDGILITFFQ